jgi:hypothetical protein
VRTIVGLVLAALLPIASVTATATPSRATGAAALLEDNVYVRSTSPATNFGTAANLVVGKGGHAYFRLDISQLDVAVLDSVVLNITKYNNAATLVATRSSEYLTNAGSPTTTGWSESNVTWNTRPLDIVGSPAVTATAPQGTSAVPLDITELAKSAKAAHSDVLTVHLTTTAVDDLTIAGTDVYSTRAPNAADRPWVQVASVTDEPAVDYPIAQRFADYPSNGASAQAVVHIAAGDGTYLAVDKATGAVHAVADVNAAGLFAIYGYRYTAADYQGLGGGAADLLRHQEPGHREVPDDPELRGCEGQTVLLEVRGGLPRHGHGSRCSVERALLHQGLSRIREVHDREPPRSPARRRRGGRVPRAREWKRSSSHTR